MSLVTNSLYNFSYYYIIRCNDHALTTEMKPLEFTLYNWMFCLPKRRKKTATTNRKKTVFFFVFFFVKSLEKIARFEARIQQKRTIKTWLYFSNCKSSQHIPIRMTMPIGCCRNWNRIYFTVIMCSFLYLAIGCGSFVILCVFFFSCKLIVLNSLGWFVDGVGRCIVVLLKQMFCQCFGVHI